MRLGYYAGASTAAAACCLLKAFHQRPNFYSATVYLSQSNACILILTNLLLVLACSFIYALQRLLYGPLRPIEIEQLSEKAWYAVLDTLLAMPSFREDVGGWLLCMFVLLLAGKVWGWIGEGRVDVLEQGQPITGGDRSKRWFHIRLATSLAVSVAFDLAMLNYCVESVMADPRPGMMVIFTFEFAVLSIFSIFTLSRYGLSLIQAQVEHKQMQEAIEARKNEIRAERAAARQNDTASGQPASTDEEPIEVDENEVDVPGWEEKRRYLFALEVLTDFIKLMIYIVFFTVSITFNGLPMHIMRDVYMTFASFSKRVSDYVAYRKATSDMNTRYPDATTEEIRGDACIVCRESMVAWEQPAAPAAPNAASPHAPARRDEGLRAKKLPCGHILHLRCLKAWLERQQVCPTCRRPVIQQTDPAGPGQPGAVIPGAPNAGGLPGAQQNQGGRPQGQARPRFFNLGPLRIGLLNGPADQVQNYINQMRNPQAANPAQQQDPNQQGPNHLGLQVPYAPGLAQPVGAQAVPGLARAAVPTQVQMLQIEQRLMHEAHNLGIEQQQLATLRVMEGEMARLRAQHLPAQQAVGTAMAAQRQIMQLPGIAAAPLALAGQQPLFAPHPRPDTLHGTGQQMNAGHEHLPHGMVLPQGWTVMPLQRVPTPGGTHAQNVVAHSQATPIQPSAPGITTTQPAPAAGRRTETENAPASTQQAEQDVSDIPRNANGSPLFEPPPSASTQDQAQNANASPSSSTESRTMAQPLRPSGTTPWAREGGWDFSSQAPPAVANTEHQQADALDTAKSEQSQAYDGKGKGRAVEIEDAPESES
jgi:E3 ubiquitin-protein ligase synoviolin